MQYIGMLAPIAFVFALAALAQVGSLKKEVDELKQELDMATRIRDKEEKH